MDKINLYFFLFLVSSNIDKRLLKMRNERRFLPLILFLVYTYSFLNIAGKVLIYSYTYSYSIYKYTFIRNTSAYSEHCITFVVVYRCCCLFLRCTQTYIKYLNDTWFYSIEIFCNVCSKEERTRKK